MVLNKLRRDSKVGGECRENISDLKRGIVLAMGAFDVLMYWKDYYQYLFTFYLSNWLHW